MCYSTLNSEYVHTSKFKQCNFFLVVMYDLWSQKAIKATKGLRGLGKNTHAKQIGIFDPLPGQSINPITLDHEKLVGSTVEALSSKENSLINYNSSAFGASQRSLAHPIDARVENVEDECNEFKATKPKPLTKKERLQRREKLAQSIAQKRREQSLRIDKDVANLTKYTTNMNKPQMLPKSESRRKRNVIPEVGENVPVQMRYLEPNDYHPLEMVHKRMKCAGMVSKRKPVANKRGHRAIRFRWSWVPYHRNHITHVKSKSK